ncbi:MAG: aspartate 1-decarboxylase [candidate division WOR-3 bacterium]
MMLKKFLKSKIHGLHITGKELYYEGSLELDGLLLQEAEIESGEMVQVVNLNNGERFETYTISAPPGSGRCVLKGAAARLGEVGDELIVMSIVYLDEEKASRHKIIKVVVDKDNRVIGKKS